MDFLRRLVRGGEQGPVEASEPIDRAELEALEREHELEVIRGEQERMDDLRQRQLRYERYAWRPPAQGGERRADDTESGSES